MLYMPDKIYSECLKQLEKLSVPDKKPYLDKLNEEIKFLKMLDMEGYYRNIQKMVQTGEIKKRGNKNGLATAFLLGITDIDPVKEGIPHNKYLGDPPDVDVDLSDQAKELIEKLLVKHFGTDHVLHIYTISLFSPKSAIRDLCRIMSLTDDMKIVKSITDFFEKDVGEDMDFETQIENFNKSINILDKKVQEFLKGEPKYKKNLPKVDQNLTNGGLLFKYAKKLSNQISNTGKHASGIAISSEPFSSFAPLKKVRGELVLGLSEGGNGKEVTMMGCLKYDYLGLTNLSRHVEFFKLAKEIYKQDLYENLIYKNNFDDQKTLDIFDNAETIGIFQFNKSGMIKALKKARIKSFNDIVIMNAMWRPGPVANLGKLFDGMNDSNTIEYFHDALIPILEPTYGIVCYQEQVMKVMQDIGGLTPAEADRSRGILKKLTRNKNPDKFSVEYYEYNKMLEKFKRGAAARGLTEEQSDQLVKDLAGHLGYSFNKSHSVAYSTISYIDAYFKANYPLIFYKVSCDYESDKDEFYRLLKDAQMRGIGLTSFDINRTNYEFTIDVEKNELLVGFNMIKGARQGDILEMIDYRKINGPFNDFDDFLKMCVTVKPNITTVNSLILLGAFDKIEPNRKKLEITYGYFQIYLKKLKNKTEKGQWKWENIYKSVEEHSKGEEIEDYGMLEKLQYEYEYLEMYLFGDPITHAQKWYKQKGIETVRVSRHDEYDKSECVLGVISNFEIKKTKKNKNFMNIDFTDHLDTIRVKVWEDKIDPKLQRKGAIAIMNLSYDSNFNSYTLLKFHVLAI